MVRVKRGFVARRKKKKLYKKNKGFRGTLKNVFRAAHQAQLKAGTHATRHRKLKKRTFRALWITRLSAAAKQLGTSYSKLMGALKKAHVNLNRKMLSEIAITDMASFKKLFEGLKL